MNRIPAYIAFGVLLAILPVPSSCLNLPEDPTPVPSVQCDTNANRVVWCKQPAPSPEVSP